MKCIQIINFRKLNHKYHFDQPNIYNLIYEKNNNKWKLFSCIMMINKQNMSKSFNHKNYSIISLIQWIPVSSTGKVSDSYIRDLDIYI